LVLVGADPLADFPDRTLAKEALDGVDLVIAIDAFRTESLKRAAVILPATMWSERAGTTTNLEGRVQRLAARVTPPGAAMDDWRIIAELALRFGVDFDLEQVEEVQAEIAGTAPAFAGQTPTLLARAQDGMRLPIAAHINEVVLTSGVGFLPEFSWEPIKPGTIFSGDEATSAEEHDESEEEAFSAGQGAQPALLTWTESGREVVAPAADAYSLRLVVGRSLYDGGRLTAASPSIAGLAKVPSLRINPVDAARIGVETNGTVRVSSPRSSLTLPVTVDDTTPAGTAFMWFTPGATGAPELIDAGSVVTDLRVETVRA
jgi:predicted molibdopterin-dependent oxidoreductase YjgC